MGRANRKIDVLLLRSDRQTSGLSKLAPLGNTVTVSRLQPFSAYSESQKTRPSSLRIRSVEAAGDIELPSRANGLQARQGVQDSRREVQSRVLQLHLVRKIHHHPLKDCRKSERVASLSSTAAGLLRDFFKSSSRALNFKKSLRRQGISFRRCVN